MFIYFQLLFIYFYSICQDVVNIIFLGFINFYIILIYCSNYSFYKIYKNNKYSFPKFSLNNNPILSKNEKILIMINYFNQDIAQNLKSFIYNIELHYYNASCILTLNCKNCDLSFHTFPNLNQSHIKNLLMDKNKIDTFPIKYLPKNLKYLSAKMCSITSLDFHHHNIQELNLSFNKLSSINISCNNLKTLYINSNQLIELKLNTPNLKFLNASNNQLEYLDISNTNLDVLNISKNQFIVLPNNFLPIKRLYIIDNPIIPNLNSYRWNKYFDTYYPNFFQNNIDIHYRNVYEDKELVHNTHINHKINQCLEELYHYLKSIKILESIQSLKDIEDVVIYKDMTVKEMMSIIIYLAKQKKVYENVLPIIEYEIEDGRYYCLSGKIGRILTAIMGFNLIKNTITVSKNEEIMAKYEIINRKLKNEFDEENNDFIQRLKEEFSQELKLIGLNENEINEWVNEVKN